jgi:hypothetical protein
VSLLFQLCGKGRFDDNKYRDCGSLEALFTALAKSFLHRSHDNFEFSDDGGLIIIPEKNITKSYVLKFLRRRHINDISHEEVSSKKHIHDIVPPIFGTPTIIQKCDIDEATGNISASLHEILHNAYECHRQHVDHKTNIQPFHYNSLEFACHSDMCIYVDSKNNEFKIGCLVCNKSALCQNVEGYDSIKEAFVDTV